MLIGTFLLNWGWGIPRKFCDIGFDTNDILVWVGIAQLVQRLAYLMDVLVVLLRFLAGAGVFLFPTISKLDLGQNFLIQWLLHSLSRGFIPAGA
jgi:hypothetical protein